MKFWKMCLMLIDVYNYIPQLDSQLQFYQIYNLKDDNFLILLIITFFLRSCLYLDKILKIIKYSRKP
jgi:hypothetical protein